MLTQYAYIKPRYQFGKQCIFSDAFVAIEDIYPNPEFPQDYVLKAHCHRGTSMQKQYALHEVQTERKITTSTGIMHSEGGWPREINPKDAELVQRFRRRMEKDDNWPIIMRGLLPTVERYVLQNNAVNIYQNFFDDLIPTHMGKHYNLRVTNLYEDPETKIRPVRHLSWSPNQAQRLAVAYGFMEFEEHPNDVSPYSYVWDIGNPNKALLKLKSSSPLMTIEYNTRDPVLLVSGLTSGQVCCWDIRASDEPVHISHPYVSHKHPAIQTLWIPSKSNTDFFSSSTDGTVLWWDVRFMKKPTETLVMDLEHPERADAFRGAGVTALQYEPTMSSKFLAGTENGLVVNVNRRTLNPLEKLALRFHCYTGPVVAIDRNPLYTKNFLTIGDWSAKIWADDTKEGCFLTTSEKNIDLSGGCWSKSRCSVFFVINRDGLLEAYDILAGMKNPLTTIRICRDSLTAIKSHEHGEFLAVGSDNGNVYLLECSDDFSSFSKDDRAALSNYLERCSRYEKAIDTRLKEIRLMQTTDVQVSFSRAVKSKRKEARDKKQARDKESKDLRSKEKSLEKERRDSRKRSGRIPRQKGKVSAKMSSPELLEAEAFYFKKIEEEATKYTEIDPVDLEAAEAILKERTATKPVEEESEHEKDDAKKRKSTKRIRTRYRPPTKAILKSRETIEEKAKDDDDVDSRRRRDSRGRGKKILKKTCPPTVVCKPEICCLDLEEKRRTQLKKKAKENEREAMAEMKADDEEKEQETLARSKSFVVDNKSFRQLSDYIAQIPQPPRAVRRRILEAKDAPPRILRKELSLAKKEMRAWQESATARTLTTWANEEKLEARIPKKIEIVVDAEHDSEKSTALLDDVQRDAKKLDARPVFAKKRARIRKAKKPVLTEEDIERIKEEKQKKLWRKLKQKVKRFDEQHKEQKVSYPRISAAFVRTSSDELVTDNSKNEVSAD
ncbi:dynein intermediate chain 3, ciliary-like [Ceratina calcarata]|uniref:Dynein intermediate chain 3, ciliary-like n=1 Tax=Ceratina calcarata TaxID=156304 RepID=A0AAJ7RX41_9HYME|nr:dynein intermediate chain 3, ciliary-like [Ceratina calcarata]